jgi:branched-chain amino acid aminotransferase
MVTIRYADGKGWYEPLVSARAPIPMDPATAVLHYAQEIFEGLRPTAATTASLFSGPTNARRFRESAARMAMALPDEPSGLSRSW